VWSRRSRPKACIAELTLVPGKLETLLTREEHYEELAKPHGRSQDFIFLGRGTHCSAGGRAQAEGSFLHPRRGYPAGEMKHGPNALIDKNLPVVILGSLRPERSQFAGALRIMPLQLLAYHISVRRASTNRGFGKVGDNRVS